MITNNINIAILASGNGTNAQRIIEYFSNFNQVTFPFILTNKENAFVRHRAESLNIPSIYMPNSAIRNSEIIIDLFEKYKIKWIILAGYLLLVPKEVIKKFPNRIINIHPALLPKYGGKGMYGENVHKAVLENNESESGITIHYVNEKYDEGNIIFQKNCRIDRNENITSLSQKIHQLEYMYYPEVLKSLILSTE